MDEKLNNLLQTLLIFKKLKIVARTSILSIIHENLVETLYEAIIAALYCKSIDLSHGIICMYDENLPENAQILIRALFETNVNFGYFLKLVKDIGKRDACAKVWFGVILNNNKIYTLQDTIKYWKENSLEELKEIEEYYHSIGDLESMRKYGFSGISFDERAKIIGKNEEYKRMYRNFSRNVHANDLVEYFKKIGFPEKESSYDFHDRDLVGLGQSFLDLYQITVFCNKSFGIQSNEILSEIIKDFELIQ